MPRIQVGGSGSSGGGGYTSGYGFQHPASSGVMATLRRGKTSTAVSLVSDSTGTDTDEWFGILAYKLAARFPNYTVLWRQWNDTNSNYDMPQVLQTGTTDGGAERYAELSSGAMRFVYGTTQQGDQDVRAKVLPTTGWAPGGGAGTRAIISRYDATGTSRGWYLWLDGNGKLNWQYSADGSTAAPNIVSTAAVPFADGTPGWVRATHDVDNGASGHTVTFYTSTDGSSWSQLGSAVTTATATTIGPTTTDVRVGGTNSTPTNFFNGRVFWVEYRPGTLGATPQPSVIPPLIEDWDQPTTGPSVVSGGAPVLMFVCGAQSGQSLTYFDDSTRRPKMLQKHGQDLHFLSTNHNEGNLTNERWLNSYAQHVTNTKSALPSVPIVTLTQNPTMSPVPAYQVQSRAARGNAIMTWAASQTGVYGLDTYQAFPTDPTALAAVVEVADGIHPTQGNGGTSGSDLWANYVYAQLFS